MVLRKFDGEGRLTSETHAYGLLDIALTIDYLEDGGLGANTGHLVVELPDEAGLRKAVLRELDRLAERQGLSGDFDDGQHYGYIKLD